MSPDAPLPDVQATTDVPLLAGRYQILDKLGEGGMGAVYRARDTQLGRQVAIKLLPPGCIHDADAVARFNREARALAHLSHPGIIQAYDSGQDGDKHFLVMELVAGHSLARELIDRGRLAPARAADYIHQAALALHHAHRNGLVHRDIKPSNLLVSAEGQVKLLDLGLARFLQDQIDDGTLTRAGVGMGTPDYAAPEQLRDAHRADVRSDVYALGCTLYHLLAGCVPFPGSSLSEKIKAHETREPTPLEELCPDVPTGLALTVQRMMAKRPADRFASMAEVAESLAAHVGASSPSFRALRDTWTGTRISTMTALPRRRLLLPWMIAGAAVLALLVLGLVGLRSGWFRSPPQQTAQGPGPSPGSSDNPSAQPAVSGKPKPAENPKKEQTPGPPEDPNVLTVSQKPEDGGKYRTITKALEAVKPGQTVRIVDKEVYQERLAIKHAGTQTGITLEAPQGAILECVTPRSFLLEISGVKNVTLRGLRLRARNTERSSLVVCQGDYTGLQLDGLDLSFEGNGLGNNGIELVGNSKGPAPVVVQGCRFRGLTLGVAIGGITRGAHIAVRDGTFTDCPLGIIVAGRVDDIQIVGNRFLGSEMTALQLQLLAPTSSNILLANNTCYEGATAFRVWDNAAHGKNVRVCNNLFLACKGMDMFHIEADDPGKARGLGKGTTIAQAYRFDHNWREGKSPGDEVEAWIPPDPKKGDLLREKIQGVDRDPKSPDFLRPDKDSPLAAAGAGKDDPSLPRYVGALPPKGVEPWDWERTWKAQHKDAATK